MPDSGFSRVNLCKNRSVLFINHSDIKPSFQPGHSHADTLSFELSLFGERVFVNTGTSEYGVSEERNRQRSTLSHNTLNINNKDSSEVWGGFRVARRAKVVKYNYEDSNAVKRVNAAHDGYTKIKANLIHHRSWQCNTNLLIISDIVKGSKDLKVCSRYHIHPNIRIIKFSKYDVLLKIKGGQLISLSVIGGELSRHPYNYHPEFGIKEKSEFIEARLTKEELQFRISW